MEEATEVLGLPSPKRLSLCSGLYALTKFLDVNFLGLLLSQSFVCDVPLMLVALLGPVSGTVILRSLRPIWEVLAALPILLRSTGAPRISRIFKVKEG